MKKAMVIDDEATIRDYVKMLLEDEGYEVVEAAGGTQAISMLRDDTDVSLIVTDVLMPNGDGVDVIRAMRRLRPQVKILTISGGGVASSNLYLENARLLGSDAVLDKPFTEEEFFECVRPLTRAYESRPN